MSKLGYRTQNVSCTCYIHCLSTKLIVEACPENDVQVYRWFDHHWLSMTATMCGMLTAAHIELLAEAKSSSILSALKVVAIRDSSATGILLSISIYS